MIAKPNQHFDPSVLRELLEDRLPASEADTLQTHLATCEVCREQLEQIAGDPPWWTETVDVLSENTAQLQSPKVTKSSETISLDSSIQWVRPLLDQPTDDSASGMGRLDEYAIDGVIGQGGMGVVLCGIDPALNRQVAIKVLTPHLAGVGAARARFMREAQSAAAIVHPSIVPIYRVVHSGRLPYIVMPWIQGGNLQQRIDREGALPIDEVLRIGLQIAEGLAAAHRQGVIHRDIKPANILVEEGNGRVLISDFGLARALDDASLTISGMIAGTPQYMSPEQAQGDPVDERSDLFSLGSLLYALSTGRPPFRSETPLAVLRKISESDPRPISQINESIPAWFGSLVQKFMRRDLRTRIATAEEAADLLRESLAHVRNPTQNDLPNGLAKNPTRLRWIVGAIAVISIAIFAAVSAMQLGDPGQGEAGIDSASVVEVLPIDDPLPIDTEHVDWIDQDFEVGLQQVRSQLDEMEKWLID